MEDFQAGEIVTLKSGSPKMTIRKVEDDQGVPSAWCEWFDGEVKKQVFPLTSLSKVEPRQPNARTARKGSFR